MDSNLETYRGDNEAEEIDHSRYYPDGSLPSVPAPRPVPTGSRIGQPETYAYGGWPSPEPAPWIVEAQKQALERAKQNG